MLYTVINLNPDGVCIFTDCRSAIQSISLPSRNPIVADIMKLIDSFQPHVQVKLQWIPSHVGIPRNDLADRLAAAGRQLHQPKEVVLEDIHARTSSILRTKWKDTVCHTHYNIFPWHPGALMELGLSRQHQRTLIGLKSGHTAQYDWSIQHYRPCPSCGRPFSPVHPWECPSLMAPPFNNLKEAILENPMEMANYWQGLPKP